MFDLREKGIVDRIAMVGVNGKKFPQIRDHMKNMIEKVREGEGGESFRCFDYLPTPTDTLPLPLTSRFYPLYPSP